MKVTNWTKKLSAAIVAAGIWVPGLAYATSIPLGDPSFEVYTVPFAVTLMRREFWALIGRRALGRRLGQPPGQLRKTMATAIGCTRDLR